MVYTLFAEGSSVKQIRDALWEAGFKSTRGTKISEHKIRDLIDSEVYIGRRIVKGKYTESGDDEIIENDHHPIVSRELDAKVKARRKQNQTMDKELKEGKYE